MKILKYTTLLLALLFCTSAIGQGYFVGSLANNGNKLVFKLKPEGGDIDLTTGTAVGITSFGVTIRYPNGSPTFNFDDVTTNTSNFPGLAANAVTIVAADSDPGFTTVLASFSSLDGTTPQVYTNGTEYELFTVPLVDGAIGATADFRVTHDEDEFPNSFYIVAGGGNKTDPGFSDYFFGPNLVENGTNEFGSNLWEQGPNLVSLPITLKSFSAEQYSANASLLNWTSTSEINASYYEVQRSTDRQVWDVVGQVKTKGSEFVGADYEMIDSNLPLAGRTNDIIYYYRLKMVDLDGAFEFSDVEAVSFDGVKRGALFVYPNPTVDEVYVTIENVETLGGTVAILDRSGKTVISQQLRTGEDERVSLRALPSGLYHLAVSQAGELHTEKVIKID